VSAVFPLGESVRVIGEVRDHNMQRITLTREVKLI
jgi:hypothetical protein